MSDVVFRTKQEQSKPAPIEQAKAGDKAEPVRETTVESPYSEYEKENGRPFILDYYDLGSLVNRGDARDSSIFGTEVENINRYIDHQIEMGEINNTKEAVENELKRIEKMANIKKDARSMMKISLLAEYVSFLLKAEGIKRASAKYGLA